MICKQKFTHRPLCLFDLFALRCHSHAVGADNRTGRLEFWHFLDPNQTHPARRLYFEILVIAKRRNPVALFAAHVNQPGTLIDLVFLLVYCYFYLFCCHYLDSKVLCQFKALHGCAAARERRQDHKQCSSYQHRGRKLMLPFLSSNHPGIYRFRRLCLVAFRRNVIGG